MKRFLIGGMLITAVVALPVSDPTPALAAPALAALAIPVATLEECELACLNGSGDGTQVTRFIQTRTTRDTLGKW